MDTLVYTAIYLGYAFLQTLNINGFNHQLKHGHYFYSDIKKEGILLYDSGKYEFAEAKKLSPEERKQ